MKAAISSPAYLQAERRVEAETDAAVPVRRALREEALNRDRGDRRLLLRGHHLAAVALRIDRVEIDPQRRIQSVVGRVVILDAGDAQVRRIVAGVDHDSRDRRLADFRHQVGGERPELFRGQVGVAASAHVEHALVVEIEAGLEAIVAAENLHRQPGGDDLGHGSGDEGPIGILGDKLVALGIDHEHDRAWRKRRDRLLEAGERRGGREKQSENEQARPHGDF